MDESWRMRMGTLNVATHRRRRSVEGGVTSSEASLEPEDFDDVFGGPPRSVMARKLSADLNASDWFYQEVFQAPGGTGTGDGGQRLPEFLIPEQRQSMQKAKSWKSKSKSTSSPVWSFEELSPYRSSGILVDQEDVALSSITSRLRPINVPCRWSSTSTSRMTKCKNKKHELPAFGCITTYTNNNQFIKNEYKIKSFIFGSAQTVPSPESIRLDLNSAKMEVIADSHLQPYSSSSAVSSLYQGHEMENLADISFVENNFYQQKIEEDDEIMSSSYIIEVNSHLTEAINSESIDIDEAIAWAKEKFQG